jgi:hypothetical protein
MTERKPSEDVKEGFGLLFRAAKNWGRGLTPEKIEATFETGAREVVKAVTTVGKAVSTELEKMVEPSTPVPPGEPVPAPPYASSPPGATSEAQTTATPAPSPEGAKVRVEIDGVSAPVPPKPAD